MISQNVFKGIVKDFEGGAVELVNVVIFDLKDNPKFHTLSDEIGRFQIEIPNDFLKNNDSILIRLYQLGANPEKISIPVSEMFNQNHVLYVKNESSQIEEITIVGQIPPVYKKSDTIFIDPREYIDSTESKIRDVLLKLPGVSVSESGLISYNGKTVSHFLIDGDNLLGSKYGTGVNSISSDIIRDIQIIENYHDNALLKGFGATDNIALNIRPQDGFLSRWAFSGENGVGYGNKIKFKTENNLIRLNDKVKNLFILNANNLNEASQFDLFNTQEFGTEVFDEIKRYFPEPKFIFEANKLNSNLPIDSKNIFFSSSGLLNLNQILRWKSNFKTYISTEIAGINASNQKSNNRILNSMTPINFIQMDGTNQKNTNTLIKVKNEYFPIPNLRIISFHEFSGFNVESKVSQTFNVLTDRRTYQSLALLRRSNNAFLITHKLSENKLFQYNSSFGHFANRSKILLNKIFIDPAFSNNTPKQIESLDQYIINNLSRINTGISFYHFNKLQSVYSLQYFYDRLQVQNNIEVSQSVEDKQDLKALITSSSLDLSSKHDYRIKDRFGIQFKPQISHLKIIDDYPLKHNFNLWDLSLRLNYDSKNKFKYFIELDRNLNLPNIQRVVPFPVVQDFTAISFGASNFHPVFLSLIKWDVVYKDVPKDIFMKVSLKYSRTSNEYVNVSELNGDFVQLKLLNIRESKGLQSLFNFSTTNLNLKSKFYIDALFSSVQGTMRIFSSDNLEVINRLYNIRGGIINNTKFLTLSLNTDVTNVRIISNEFSVYNNVVKLGNNLNFKYKSMVLGYSGSLCYLSSNGNFNKFYYDHFILKINNIGSKKNFGLKFSLANPWNQKYYHYNTVSEYESSVSTVSATERIFYVGFIIK